MGHFTLFSHLSIETSSFRSMVSLTAKTKLLVLLADPSDQQKGRNCSFWAKLDYLLGTLVQASYYQIMGEARGREGVKAFDDLDDTRGGGPKSGGNLLRFQWAPKNVLSYTMIDQQHLFLAFSISKLLVILFWSPCSNLHIYRQRTNKLSKG